MIWGRLTLGVQLKLPLTALHLCPEGLTSGTSTQWPCYFLPLHKYTLLNIKSDSLALKKKKKRREAIGFNFPSARTLTSLLQMSKARKLTTFNAKQCCPPRIGILAYSCQLLIIGFLNFYFVSASKGICSCG